MKPVDVARAGVRSGLLPGVVVALVVLAPVLRRGYVAVYDMVFVPEQPLRASLLGLDGSVPRAVPSDLLIALAGHVVPADVVQKAVLLAILAGAFVGMWRLVPATAWWARVAAALFYVWNPYVYERLAIGQWALLVGYAALPWVVRAALALRDGERRAWAPLVLALAISAVTITGGVLAATLALAVVLSACVRRRAGYSARLFGGKEMGAAIGVAAIALVVNLPWLLPSVLRPGGVPGDPAGVEAFAARADTALGVIGSLLSLGGIWNAEAVPPGRDHPVIAVVTIGALAVALLGLPVLRRAWGSAALAVGAVALVWSVVAAAGALPGLREVAELVVEHVPGGGLIRDGQKLVAPLALLEALGFGLGVDWLAGRLRSEPAWLLPAALTALPLAVLPALAWGLAGRFVAVSYPPEWQQVRAAVAEQPGDVAVLPWHAYRAYGWNAWRTWLDPAPRVLDRDVVVNDDLELTSLTVEGENPRAAAIERAVEGGGSLLPALQGAGVGLVLVERDQPGSDDAQRRLQPARQVWASGTLVLYEVPDPRPYQAPRPPAAPIVAGDAVALALIVLAAAARVRPALARVRRTG